MQELLLYLISFQGYYFIQIQDIYRFYQNFFELRFYIIKQCCLQITFFNLYFF